MKREQPTEIAWRVNGRPVAPGEWVCTSYAGREDLSLVDGDNCKLALWEADIPRDQFLALYGASYQEIIDEEQQQEPYEWGMVLEYDRLRHAGYPDLETLICDHADALRGLLLGDTQALLECVFMAEPRHYERGYAVHALNEVVVLEDRLILAGIALEQEEI